MSKLKLLLRRFIFNFLCPVVFNLYSKKSVDKKLILFGFNGNYKSFPDNLKPIYDKMKADGYNCMVFGNYTSRLKELLDSIRFQKYYAQAHCVFVSDTFQPVYCHKSRKETQVVQVWHACGAFKKWGHSTLDKKWGASRKDANTFPLHNTYTLVSVSAETVIPCYAEAFNCEQSVVKALGTPRTDVYFDESFVSSQRKLLEEKYPAIKNKKVILYAPTFRGNSLIESYMDNRLDIENMRKNLSDDYVLLLKLHPLTAKSFSVEDDDFVINISKTTDIDTALCSADILISDYSSVIFEYALLSRPMIFFAYDLEEYDRDRSFYFDYRSFVPGNIVVDTNEIITEIKRLENEFNPAVVAEFKDKYMSACDGHSTDRIVDFIK
ncbi:MAG: CDP-glycerol glycerophosphotransferase family protein [Clostridia bacterium]|nr:CDP-glycerol glycerophosphotransferase family protein [Clostridia bacterium]